MTTDNSSPLSALFDAVSIVSSRIEAKKEESVPRPRTPSAAPCDCVEVGAMSSTVKLTPSHSPAPITASPTPPTTLFQDNASKFKQEKRSFPQVLMAVLEDPDNNEVITFLPDGKNFAILKPKSFAQDIMPRCFSIRTYCSFTRKLQRWGFEKIPGKTKNDVLSYRHALFEKGDHQNASKIKCKNSSKKRVLPAEVRRVSLNPCENYKPSLSSTEMSADHRYFVQLPMSSGGARRERFAQTAALIQDNEATRRQLLASIAAAESKKRKLDLLLNQQTNQHQHQHQHQHQRPPQQQRQDINSVTNSIVGAALRTLARDDEQRKQQQQSLLQNRIREEILLSRSTNHRALALGSGMPQLSAQTRLFFSGHQ